MGNKPEEGEICVQSQIPLWLWRWITPVAGMLSWGAIHYLGEIDWEGVVVELPSMSEVTLGMDWALGEDDEGVEGLWAWIKWQTGKGDAVVGVCYRLPRQEWRGLMRPSTGSSKRPQSPRCWFLWEILTTLTSTKETTQWSTNHPGGSWKALMTTSWQKKWMIPQGMVCCLISY